MESVTKNKNENEKKDEIQCLTFCLKSEVFGIEILRVKEILEYGNITPIPLVPDYIRGVLNLRGNVVPIIDLTARFGLEKSSITKLSCIIIVEARTENETIDMGIVIDAVNEVLNFDKEEIEETPSFGTKIRTDFINGMGKVDEKFIILLNVDKILDVEELSQLKGVKAKKKKTAEQEPMVEDVPTVKSSSPSLQDIEKEVVIDGTQPEM